MEKLMGERQAQSQEESTMEREIVGQTRKTKAFPVLSCAESRVRTEPQLLRKRLGVDLWKRFLGSGRY